MHTSVILKDCAKNRKYGARINLANKKRISTTTLKTVVKSNVIVGGVFSQKTFNTVNSGRMFLENIFRDDRKNWSRKHILIFTNAHAKFWSYPSGDGLCFDVLHKDPSNRLTRTCTEVSAAAVVTIINIEFSFSRRRAISATGKHRGKPTARGPRQPQHAKSCLVLSLRSTRPHSARITQKKYWI